MVNDESAGTKTFDKQVRFPDGVPAIADENMSPWMEYVYMQQNKPTNIKGVPVVLTALDPNGNTLNIGNGPVTANADGKFALLWTPPVPGVYTIKASFEGSESYYGSYSTTSIGVVQASGATPSVPTPTPEVVTPTPTPIVTPTSVVTPIITPSPVPSGPGTVGIGSEVYIAIAAIVIIAIVVAAAILLRRRK
jgi:hypothetical protein